MKKLKILLLASLLIMIMAGCKNQNKKSDKGFTFEQEQAESNIRDIKSVINLFPAPGEILTRFYNADLEYNEGILHDPGSASEYTSSRDKGLNLGVYISDLAYSALFSRNSEAAGYMEVVRKLSNDLDVSNIAFESLAERLVTNIGNNDSLIVIGNEAFYNVLEFLETTGREKDIAVITTGAYIESMFLAMNSIEVYDERDPILREITELKYPLENLLNQAESVSEAPAVQGILDYIRELDDIFSELESEGIVASVEEPGVITLSGGSLPEITAENFSAIKASVTTIRATIVGN